ncbi:AraC family transcriptional regulator [Acinetobacter nectaris]|uniref:AraC family transcriptional regulator n=1 Tax=Acinetobacter nectaris TaxID=1219382 RepID=UPI001F176600|nr:AraC family transcriptional regulator [Acinetobacter nectaris]
MNQRTDSAVVIRLAYQAVNRLGLPVESIFKNTHLMQKQMGLYKRIPQQTQYSFWKEMIALSQDTDIGLHLGEHLPLFRGQIIEQLFVSSSSFGEGLQRTLPYQRLISDAFQATLVVEGNECYLKNNKQPHPNNLVNRHFSECAMFGVIQFFKFMTDGAFKPNRIDFDFREGAQASEYVRVYHCPVSLGQVETRLYFDTEILNYHLWQAEPELLHLHEGFASKKLVELTYYDLIDDVRAVIARSLKQGEITLEMIATDLGMSARQLRHRLQEANTSFQQLLGEYRCRLSKRLLKDSNESIEQIVVLTGFAEPSTFYRAFKRWTNETPIEYRKRKQSPPSI